MVYEHIRKKFPDLPSFSNILENPKFYQNNAITYKEPLTSRKPDIFLQSDDGKNILFEADHDYSEILAHIADLRIYGLYNEEKELFINEYNIIWFSKGKGENWENGFHKQELKEWKASNHELAIRHELKTGWELEPENPAAAFAPLAPVSRELNK